jgi:hypothetical protein
MSKISSSFEELYRRQYSYNIRIRSEKHDSKVEWTKTYLLGLTGQVKSVLEQLAWKRHRILEATEPNRYNLAYEFADLTKYVLSLWELWGFTSQDIIDYCEKKSDLLETVWYEDREVIPDNTLVVVTDLDGTLADWRGSFRKYLQDKDFELKEDSESTLEIEVELELNYTEYNVLKNDFESEGGYGTLIPYRDAVNFVRDLGITHNIYVVAFTARPFHRHKRIWTDTWDWIRSLGLPIKQLRAGSESRIAFAVGLKATHKVILLEDNPEFILRAANSGIFVIARRHPYNIGITHKNAMFVDSFDQIDLKEILCKIEQSI